MHNIYVSAGMVEDYPNGASYSVSWTGAEWQRQMISMDTPTNKLNGRADEKSAIGPPINELDGRNGSYTLLLLLLATSSVHLIVPSDEWWT